MIRHLLLASGVCLFSCLPQAINAQFADALIPSYTYGLAPVISNVTGNDIADISGVTYEVCVADDQSNNSMMGWKVGASIGYAQIGTGVNVLQPDVALVKNAAGVVYAVVTYFDQVAFEFRLQTYLWSVPLQIFNPIGNVMISPGAFHKTLQIASDDAGVFAIVWDEPGEQIRLAIGQASGGAPPALLLGGQVFGLEPGSQPDVCVYRSVANGDRQVNVVFVNASGFVSLDYYTWPELTAGVINPNQMFRSAAADLQYRYPKVACPGSAYGKKDDFTVVVEDSDNNSTWYIKGYNVNFAFSGGFSLHIYNNGSSGNSPWNLTSVPNTRPVVTYDHIGEEIRIAWNVDNSWGILNSPWAVLGSYPVALSGSRIAGINPGANYLIIPSGLANYDSHKNVSLSGNKSAKALFTYNNLSSFEIYSKAVPHLANTQNLRQQQPQTFNQWISQLSSEQNRVTLQMYDVAGRSIINFNGDSKSVNEKFAILEDQLTSGIYIIKAEARGQDISLFTGKVVIKNL